MPAFAKRVNTLCYAWKKAQDSMSKCLGRDALPP